MTMYKFLLAIAIALIVRPYVYAADHYSLHSFKGNVTIESKGRSTKACKGMTLNPTDNIVIPNGGSAEVYNSLDKQIYRSATPGRISELVGGRKDAHRTQKFRRRPKSIR